MFKVEFSPAPPKFLRAPPGSGAIFNVFGNVAPIPPTCKLGKTRSKLSSSLVLLVFFAGDGDFIMSAFKLALRVLAASLLVVSLLKRFIGDGFAWLTLPLSSSSSKNGDNDVLLYFFFCVVVEVNGNFLLPSMEGCGDDRCCDWWFLLTTLLDFTCCCCCEVSCFDGDFFAVVGAIFCIGIAATFLLLPLVC